MPESVFSLLVKFIKFGLVGFSGLLLDFGITYLCKEKGRWNKYLANSTGFGVACISNFLLNRAWTFQSADPSVTIQFGKFLVIAVVGLGLNNLVVYLLTEKLQFNFYLAKFCAVVLVFFWNFSLNYLFTFAG
jgi:putative flippase GtrA